MTALTIVTDFCAAWDRLDWPAIHAALADDIFYHNIPMAPCHGLAEFKAFFAPFPLTAAKFDIHNITATGNTVMTERTDHLHMGENAIVLRVMGVFEIRDGKIAAWRDYFDMAEFTSQMPSG